MKSWKIVAVMGIILLWTVPGAGRGQWSLVSVASPQTDAKIAYLLSQTQNPDGKRLSLSSAYQVVVTSANVHGAFGSWFKTMVSIFNPTNTTYALYCSLYSTAGLVATRQTTLHAKETATWDNFLGDAFGFEGAGTLEFDAWFDPPGGSSDFDFIIQSATYNDGPYGRYSTVVMHGAEADTIGSTYPDYNIGINVNASQRTNIGCWNRASIGNALVYADIYASGGILIATITMNVPTGAWQQVAVPYFVTNGFIKWRTNATLVYPYAVVVDNVSNDGTFAPATTYVD